MTPSASPRLHVIRAEGADVAAVFCRISAKKWQLFTWRLRSRGLEPGGTFRGILYPRRSTLSVDGTYLHYHALTGQRSPWGTFSAISKLPWLTALAAFETGGTWTSARSIFISGRMEQIARPCTIQMVDGAPPIGFGHPPLTWELTGGFGWQWGVDQRGEESGAKASDHRPPIAQPVLAALPPMPATYAGWQWARKSFPAGTLHVVQSGHDFPSDLQKGSWIEGYVVAYAIERGGDVSHLKGVRWADSFDEDILLTATDDGRIQMRNIARGTVEWEYDFSGVVFTPNPSPESARSW
jgi:hypothetical protein